MIWSFGYGLVKPVVHRGLGTSSFTPAVAGFGSPEPAPATIGALPCVP